MKALCLFVVCLVAVAAPSAAQEVQHVRALDTWAGESLDRGLARSALVRALVTELNASDVIVHVQTTTLALSIAGTTRFATAAGGYRYVRVVLSRDLLPASRAAILGHELHHACEIARSAARDRQAVARLFSAIGRRLPGEDGVYETDAAARAGATVWRELHRSDKRAARAQNNARRN